MSHQSSLREIAAGSLVTLFGVGLHFFLQYVMLVMVSRFWGAAGLGLFVTGLTVLWLGGLFRLGLTGGALRYVALLKGRGHEGAIGPLLLNLGKVSLLCSLAGGALLFVFAGSIGRMLDEPGLVPLLRVLAAGISLWNLVNIGIFAIQGLRSMNWLVSVRDLGQPGLAVAAVVVAGLFGASVTGATAAYVLSLLPALALAVVGLARLLPSGSGPAPTVPVREVIFFSFPLIWTQLVTYGVRQQEILILAYFLPAAEVGLYSAGLKTSVLVCFILNATNSIFAPVLANLHGSGDLEVLRRLYRTVSRWGFTLAFPLFIACLLYGRELLSLWGAEFGVAWPVLTLLAGAQLVNVATGAAGNVLIMGARQKVELTNTVLALFLGFGLDILLIPKFGIMGAAVAAGFSMTAVNLLRVAQTYRLWGANPFNVSYLKPLGVGALATGAVYLVDRWTEGALGFGPQASFALGVILLGVLYVGGLWLAGFDLEDREVARSLVSRLQSRRRKDLQATAAPVEALAGAPLDGAESGLLEGVEGRN